MDNSNKLRRSSKSAYAVAMMGALIADSMNGNNIDEHYKIRQKRRIYKCLLPSCNKRTNHNGGYCSAECCKENRKRIKDERLINKK